MCIGIPIVISIYNKNSWINERDKYLNSVKPLIDKYKNDLSIEMLRHKYIDQHGKLHYDKGYDYVIDDFIEKVIFTNIRPPERYIRNHILHITDFYIPIYKMVEQTAIDNSECENILKQDNVGNLIVIGT
jgi:hypothetical protein